MFAYINFVDKHGHPIDPGFGNKPEGPVDPGFGNENPIDPGFGNRPGFPPINRPWPPTFPPRPTDPSWGVGGGIIRWLPILIGPGVPLPPVDGGGTPPTDPPPGTIWPPLPPFPPGSKPPTKAALLVWIEGVGCRYVVVELAPPDPGGPVETETGTLGAYLDTTATVVSLKAPSKTAKTGIDIKIGVEYMTVTDASDPSKLAVTRGTAGTIEVHPAGVIVEIGVTLPAAATPKKK